MIVGPMEQELDITSVKVACLGEASVKSGKERRIGAAWGDGLFFGTCKNSDDGQLLRPLRSAAMLSPRLAQQ